MVDGSTEGRERPLLRFVAVGSVDDGKSTLIGRLLYDLSALPIDQVAAMKAASQRVDSSSRDAEIDFSLATDGLTAEREQGITIDVAYRYFATDRAKFIVADCPGHVQYTRNMATGASTAAAGLLLVDATRGLVAQTHRHAAVLALLGVRRVAAVVNKMDLVDYDQSRFDRLSDELNRLLLGLGVESTRCIPVAATRGINVTTGGGIPWYEGPTVLEFLEQAALLVPPNDDEPLRLPVQVVLRPEGQRRAHGGRIASGRLETGQPVRILPSGVRSSVATLAVGDKPVTRVDRGDSVTLTLADEVDVGRGDMIVSIDSPPFVAREFEASLVWTDERPLDLEKTYLLQHTTQRVRVQVEAILGKHDLEAHREVPTDGASLNDIVRVRLKVVRALYFDDYRANRTTGSFILIDSLTNATAAAGMIQAQKTPQSLEQALEEARAGSALRQGSMVSHRERVERLGHPPGLIWLMGRPGSGRWSLAYALERRLFDLGYTATVLSPDLSVNADQAVAAALTAVHAGLVVIGATTTVVPELDDLARREGAPRLRVLVDTPVEIASARRPERGSESFTPPSEADLVISMATLDLESGVRKVLDAYFPLHSARRRDMPAPKGGLS